MRDIPEKLRANYARQRINNQNGRIDRYLKVRCSTCRYSFWPNDITKNNHLTRLTLVCYYPHFAKDRNVKDENGNQTQTIEYKFIGLRHMKRCKMLNFYNNISTNTIIADLGNKPTKEYVKGSPY